MKRLILIITGVFLFSGISGQSVNDHNARKQELEEEIAFLDRQLESTLSKQKAGTKELDFIRKKISNRKRLIEELERELSGIDADVASKEANIFELNAKLSELKKSYSHLIYNAYKNRDKTLWIMHILASKNLEQGYRRWGYFRSFRERLEQMASEISGRTEKLNREKEELALARDRSLSAQKKKQQELNTLSKDEGKAKDVIAGLRKKEGEVRQQLAVKKREMERLNREIERILAKAASEKKSPGYVASDADIALSGNFESNKGKLPWPVRSGVVVEEFGQHNHPVFKDIKLPFNNGVNIASEAGSDVFAVFEGVVKQILIMPGYNQCVLIQHGDYFTFYTKLDKVTVKSGEKVSILQKIGSLAVNGKDSEIHFQLWKGTMKQNPLLWITKRNQ